MRPHFFAVWKRFEAEQSLEMSLGGQGKGLPFNYGLVFPILPSPGRHREPHVAFFRGEMWHKKPLVSPKADP